MNLQRAAFRLLRLVGFSTLSLVLITSALISTVNLTHAAQATPKPLPPTWTPEPSFTPPPTLGVPTVDTSFPTSSPIPTLKPVMIEQAQLYAPLYYLSKRRSAFVYIARAEGTSPDATKLFEPAENVLAFDIAPDGRLAYSTSSGQLLAAGRAKSWKASAAPLKIADPLRPLSLDWSPDGTTLAFSIQASDRDFALMKTKLPTGVYLWASQGDPKQIISDKPVGPDQVHYSVESWSPDGKRLLIRFTEPQAYGWELYTFSTKALTRLARFTSSDSIQYQQALWLPDGSKLLLCNSQSNKADDPGGAALVDFNAVQTPITFTSKDKDANNNPLIPKVTSGMGFLPDGRIVVLGSTARTDPIQVYVGMMEGLQVTLKPIGKAFRLKWPGRLLTSPSGFPIYVLDQQYGVIVFNSANTKAYDPAQLGMSATDGPVYDETALPGWRFGPANVTLPTVAPAK